ncbi:hypothetical protein Rsub_13056 [Raphidocelis subcapitata]|uniref:Vacuolar transporter chaperone n=1 Tax=Raphidocelis subcapitata TaxID=307507 RepID=A0A2V0PQA7_9CHLO|nr:hypothetical protein Rsub_13056 [Raphidocelis subcapitata]|eukprot:GBG00374.1 hypothetical protein Rsub_13056 [Raphidocelis subcapitata]
MVRIRWYGSGEPRKVFMERKTHRESWKGEESVKERFTMDASQVVPFLEMEYDWAKAEADLRAAGKSDEEIGKFQQLFNETRGQIDSKQLRPFIRTQYMRTAFQIPFDATVRVSMDTNLCMIKENPDDGPSCTLAGRWYRDPSLPIQRNEITRFPHAVLEVKLSLNEGQSSPSWVQELLDSGYLTEVHKFSKFIHGTCTLFPELVQAVPYWVDDESVRPSMLLSAPPGHPANNGPSTSVEVVSGNGAAAEEEPLSAKPRKRTPGLEDLQHPLLGDEPTLKLLPDRSQIKGFGAAGAAAAASAPWWQKWLGPREGAAARARPAGAPAMRIEPKTFFANERTFLSWLHMSVTIGSIAAALLSFSGSDTNGASNAQGLGAHLVTIIALLLLPVAIAMNGYAIFVFIWRGQMILRKRPSHFDDRVGPLGLCAAVVTALAAILIVSLVDFVDFINTPTGPEPPAPSPSLAGGAGGASPLLAANAFAGLIGMAAGRGAAPMAALAPAAAVVVPGAGAGGLPLAA